MSYSGTIRNSCHGCGGDVHVECDSIITSVENGKTVHKAGKVTRATCLTVALPVAACVAGESPAKTILNRFVGNETVGD